MSRRVLCLLLRLLPLRRGRARATCRQPASQPALTCILCVRQHPLHRLLCPAVVGGHRSAPAAVLREPHGHQLGDDGAVGARPGRGRVRGSRGGVLAAGGLQLLPGLQPVAPQALQGQPLGHLHQHLHLPRRPVWAMVVPTHLDEQVLREAGEADMVGCLQAAGGGAFSHKAKGTIAPAVTVGCLADMRAPLSTLSTKPQRPAPVTTDQVPPQRPQ